MVPGTILHQRHELPQNKAQREDKGIKTEESDRLIEGILNYKGPHKSSFKVKMKSNTQRVLVFELKTKAGKLGTN